MNRKTLFHIIGEISDDLIIEAGNPVKKVRRIRISRAAGLAAALIILLGLTAFASSIIVKSRSSTSTNTPDYNTVPSQHTLQKDIGIAPCILEQFSNGYLFKTGFIVKNEDYDEFDKVFEKYKSLSCEYLRDSNQLTLHVDGSISGIQMDDSETAEIYKKSRIKYSTYMNKLVPGNYQLTEQDKKDKASGKYVFSFGGDEIEINEVQILGWEYDGLSYTICAINNSITKNELIQMAKEIIDCQK